MKRTLVTGVTLGAIVAAAAPVVARAQDVVITGRVTSQRTNGDPLAGASIGIAELGVGTLTNSVGTYTLTVPAARVRGQTVTLQARAIGLKPIRRAITLTPGRSTQNFDLQNDVTRLSEVVVTGVAEGTERVKLPIAVARVTAEDLPAPVLNPLTQLQGRVTGANIVSTTGRPGAAPQVLLRAPTSINAEGRGQNPLFIVDGVILADGDGLADINPADIEAVEVVKGAAAASLYGARAGNGVIQITTKSGKNGADGTTRFTVRSEYGQNSIERRFGLAQNHVYLTQGPGGAFCANRACSSTFNWQDEVLRLNSNQGPLPLAPNFSPQNNGTTPWNTFQVGRWPGQTFDAIDQVVDPGPFGNVDAQITGRYGNTSLFTSANYLRQNGSFIGLNGFERGSLRLNAEQRFGSDFTMQLNTFYARSQSDGLGVEGGALFDLTRMPRGVNLLARDTVQGEFIIRPDLQGENENPVYALVNQQRNDQTDRFLGGLNASYKPVEWFDLSANASYDRRNVFFNQFNFRGFRTARTSAALNDGQVFNSDDRSQSYNGALTATFRWSPRSDLRTTLQGRYLYEQQDFAGSSLVGRGLVVRNTPSPENVTPGTRNLLGGFDESVRQIGYFAIGNVDFKDRYILDGLVRRDGASVFGPENRWATFGRLSAAWRVSQESWFDIPKVDELKFRYSFGTAGNRPNFAAQYEVWNISDGQLSPLTLGNRRLGRELVAEHEAGLDATLFGRANVTLTYSSVTTRDQLLQVPLPAAAGFPRQWQNAGTLRGNTVEASLDIPWVQRKDFTFSTRLQGDRSRATITALKVAPFTYGAFEQGLEGAFFARVGERLGTIYGTRFATGCGDLPQGTNCANFRTNSDGLFVWTGGADVGGGARYDAQTGLVTVAPNTWGTQAPVGTLPGRAGAASQPFWGAPVIAQASPTDANLFLPLGNTLPDFRLAFSPNVTYKRFGFTALFDGSFGQDIYNQGRHWAYFENYAADQDQLGRADAALKPVGYYGANTGLYNVLQPNSHFVEDGSFVKLRELTLSYRFGKVRGVAGNWNVAVIGRNLKTWTNYTGFDPEVGINGGNAGSGIINAFDAFRFPNLRTVTFAISSTF